MSKLKTFHFEGAVRISLREIHSRIGDSFSLFNESKISLPARWCTSPHLQTAPWPVENTLQQQSHQSKDRLRMGPTQSWSQPPPPSPDFFLWGCLKDRVYKTNPQTIGELKRNIQTEMEAIDEATCRAVMSNFIRRMKMRVSIRKEDTWSNCCRMGYTPVRVLIFYVTVFILIKSIF